MSSKGGFAHNSKSLRMAAAGAVMALALGGCDATAAQHPAPVRPVLCRFSDAGNDGAIDALGRPASEKRQGRKSRSVVQRRCGVRYGDLAAGLGLKRSNRSGCGGWFGADRG